MLWSEGSHITIHCEAGDYNAEKLFNYFGFFFERSASNSGINSDAVKHKFHLMSFVTAHEHSSKTA